MAYDELTSNKKMLGGAGHSSLERGEVGSDAIYMEVNKRLLAFFAEEEVAVGVVVHEEVFGERGCSWWRALVFLPGLRTKSENNFLPSFQGAGFFCVRTDVWRGSFAVRARVNYPFQQVKYRGG